VTAALLPFIILAPLLGAAIAVTWARAAAHVALATALAVVAAVAALATRVLRHGAVLHEAGAWPAPLGIELRVDGLAVLLLCIAAIIGVCHHALRDGVLPADASRTTDRGVRFFWPLWLLLWAALNASSSPPTCSTCTSAWNC
jgi:multicomponent Na+:H+ antiporter subunit D